MSRASRGKEDLVRVGDATSRPATSRISCASSLATGARLHRSPDGGRCVPEAAADTVPAAGLASALPPPPSWTLSRRSAPATLGRPWKPPSRSSIPPCAPGSSAASGAARPSRRRAGWPAIAARARHADRRADRLGQDARRVPRLHRPPAAARARRGELAGRDATSSTSRRSRRSRTTSSENLERAAARRSARVARELGPRAAARSASRCAPATRPPSSAPAMLRRPPHILVTTPESLYLLLTAEREPRAAARACAR